MYFSSRLATAVFAAAMSVTTAHADIITYDVNLHFNPNSTPSSDLSNPSKAYPGTVTGTITIDTSRSSGSPGNLVGVDLWERTNNGTPLNGFTGGQTSWNYATVDPYTIIFLWSPVTEYPAYGGVTSKNIDGQFQTYEYIDLYAAGVVFDSIQVGPEIHFDFNLATGGSVLPGNFDSQASTGFDAFLFGTVTPETGNMVPEPSSFFLLGIGGIGIAYRMVRRRFAAV